MTTVSHSTRNNAGSAYDHMRRKVKSGAYGTMASIDPRWCGDNGFKEFLSWYVQFAPVADTFASGAAISKDILGPSNVFSPETSVVVPRKFLQWFHVAMVSYRPKMAGDRYAIRYPLLSWSRTSRKPNAKQSDWLDSLTEVEDFWRAKMHEIIEPFKETFNRINPAIMPRLYEIVEERIVGNRPGAYFFRHQLKRK